MPTYRLWLVPGHVIYQAQVGHISKAEYTQSTLDSNAMIEKSPEAEVHFINDSVHMTASDVTINELRESIQHIHPRLGFTLVIQPTNPALRPLVNLISSMMGFFFKSMHLKLLTSGEETLAFLAENRPALAPLLPAKLPSLEEITGDNDGE